MVGTCNTAIQMGLTQTLNLYYSFDALRSSSYSMAKPCGVARRADV